MGNRDDRSVYTIEEWARLMGSSVASAYNWAHQNKIPGLIRLGTRRYVVSKMVTDRILMGGYCPSEERTEAPAGG